LLKYYLIVFISLISCSVFSDPSISVATKYYKVNGLTENELRQSLSKRSPVKEAGKTFDAYTAWNIKWRFFWEEKDNHCEINKVNVTLKVNFTLPNWSNKDKASFALQSKWNKYYQVLVAHENGHKQLGVDSAREIERKLLGLSSSGCKRLEKKANELAQKILAKYKKLEKVYDIDTNHGMNRGAVFP